MNSGIIGLVGVAMLVIGVLSPVRQLPILGGVSDIRVVPTDGFLLLALGAWSLFALWANKIHVLLFTGLISAGMLAFTAYQLVRTGMGLAGGWGLLLIGAALMLFAGFDGLVDRMAQRAGARGGPGRRGQ